VLAQKAASPGAAPSGQVAPPTIHVSTSIVVLDVVATDKQGRTVEDLTQDDFIVTEDKIQQAIRSFERPSQHAPPPGDIVHSAADLAKIGAAPVNVLVLDELNTRFEDNTFSRFSLQRFLRAQPKVMPPTTLLVVNDNKFAVLHDYTQDRDALEAALKKDPVQYPWRLRQGGNTGPEAMERLAQSLSALEEIAQASTGTPGRKNIIWVGKGFPSVDLTGLDEASARPMRDAIKRCTTLLLNGRTTLYIIDPTPISSATYDLETPTDLATLEDETGTEPFKDSIRFSVLAPSTGGRVFSERNDVDREIASSIHDGTTYYTLSYSPSNKSDESGEYRSIRITIKRPGLTATTRDGYYPRTSADPVSAANPSASSGGLEVTDIANAALSTMVYNGLKIRVGKIAAGRFSLGVAGASLHWKQTPDGEAQASVSITAVCFSAKGKVLSHTSSEKTLIARPSSASASSDESVFSMPVDAPEGTVRIRFVARDKATERIGTADLANP
jgi:VWFA-related protein